jgi:hypothetical protein
MRDGATTAMQSLCHANALRRGRIIVTAQHRRAVCRKTPMINERNQSALETAREPQGRTPDVAHDTLPPSTSRPTTVEPDETAGLVSVLYHAQQSVLQSSRFAKDARDAHDEELALFLEESQRECESRIARAKRLLAARLSQASTVLIGQPHEAGRDRVPYVSVPDQDRERLR